MIEITSANAAGYLQATALASRDEPIVVRELTGGVSNVVLLVTLPDRGERFVLKQARGRLRVKAEWLCPVERIRQEVEALRICGDLLQVRNDICHNRADVAGIEACVPRVLWEDSDNYCYAMTAAPESSKTWKELLLAGETNLGLAAACGQLLGRLHAGSWQDSTIAARLDNRTYFDQLRLDPYYRHIARVHADLAPHIERLIQSVWRHRCCLVHGDFSPKNLLVWPERVMLIDFEVGHFGDPAFDLGFFLTHLVLKSVWAGERRGEYLRLADHFWDEYRCLLAGAIPADELAALENRMVWNLAGCMLARVDGKSPVDYLSAEHQKRVRHIARTWVADPRSTWKAAVSELTA